MRENTEGWALAACAVAMMLGCGSGYTVRRADRTVPTPEGTTFHVLPVSFANASMYGTTFESWVAEDPERQQTWVAAQASFDERFDARLAESAEGQFHFAHASDGAIGGGALGVRVRITELSRFAARGFLHGTIEIIRPDGTVIDELYVEIEVGGSFHDRQTVSGGGDIFARRLLHYLRERARS